MRTISCDQARVDIPLYIERELPPDENLVTAYHLAACAPCSQVADADRELLIFSAGLDAPDPPSGIVSNVIKQLRSARAATSPRAVKWAALGLTLLLAAASQLRLSGGQTVGWTLLLRLSEFLHFKEVVTGVSGLVPNLLPSTYSLLDLFLNGTGASVGGSGSPEFLSAFYLFMLAITLSTCAFSGVLILSGAYLARPRQGYRQTLRGFLTRS